MSFDTRTISDLGSRSFRGLLSAVGDEAKERLHCPQIPLDGMTFSTRKHVVGGARTSLRREAAAAPHRRVRDG